MATMPRPAGNAICVGIDLTCRGEIEEALSRHGWRYLKRVYTERELEQTAGDALRLAACFAAKEAVMKALRREDEALSWREIALERDRLGRPEVHLTGAAQRLAQSRGVVALALSVSHVRDSATAVAVARSAR
jgi:holo-[acyl-carrier protein] synthase